MKNPVGARPMKISILAALFERFASSVTSSSGSTVKERVWFPIAASVGTVQLTVMRCSLYAGIGGTVSLMLVPSGTMTSISVAGEVSTPRFCAGIDNVSKSPGNAAYPIAGFNVTVSVPRVRVTIIESLWAIKSIATTFRSMTTVVAPIISVTGSQTITPLLE